MGLVRTDQYLPQDSRVCWSKLRQQWPGFAPGCPWMLIHAAPVDSCQTVKRRLVDGAAPPGHHADPASRQVVMHQYRGHPRLLHLLAAGPPVLEGSATAAPAGTCRRRSGSASMARSQDQAHRRRHGVLRLRPAAARCIGGKSRTAGISGLADASPTAQEFPMGRSWPRHMRPCPCSLCRCGPPTGPLGIGDSLPPPAGRAASSQPWQALPSRRSGEKGRGLRPSVPHPAQHTHGQGQADHAQ